MSMKMDAPSLSPPSPQMSAKTTTAGTKNIPSLSTLFSHKTQAEEGASLGVGVTQQHNQNKNIRVYSDNKKIGHNSNSFNDESLPSQKHRHPQASLNAATTTKDWPLSQSKQQGFPSKTAVAPTQSTMEKSMEKSKEVAPIIPASENSDAVGQFRRIEKDAERRPSVTDYPDMLRRYFPGIKYALAYGSTVFPFETVDTSPSYVRSSATRLLDLLLVLPESPSNAKGSLVGPGHVRNPVDDGGWNFVDSGTRSAAFWHSENVIRHPSHYSWLMRTLYSRPYDVGRFQRSAFGVPIVHFPFVRLPKTTGQASATWCKYGVVCEEDLIQQLTHWPSLYLPGRFHKAVLTFDSKNPSSYETPPSLAAALRQNRIKAIQTALLMLPERFTLGTLLFRILSLSYNGDIRFAIRAENPQKITELLHAQALLLADIYLPLLLSEPGLLTAPTPPQPEIRQTVEYNAALPSPLDDQPPQHAAAPAFKKPSSTTPIAPRLAEQQQASASRTPLPALLNIVGSPSAFRPTKQNSEGNRYLESSTLQRLQEAAIDLCAEARGRLMGLQSGPDAHRIEALDNDRRALKAAILSEEFVFEQDLSLEARQHVFKELPANLQNVCGAASSGIRFNRLFSPASLTMARMEQPLGRPMPHEALALNSGVKQLVRPASIRMMFKGLISAGPVRSSRYVAVKLLKGMLRGM